VKHLTIGLVALCVVAACAGPRPLTTSATFPKQDLAVTVPDSFLVAFETSRGRFDVMARSSWAPLGVQRLFELLAKKYYDDVYFFRVVPNFVAQFGLSGDSTVNANLRPNRLTDEPVGHSNSRGTLSFARGDPNTRTVQLFINLRDNARLDTLNTFGFPPIAEVVSGMDIVDSLYSGYGDAPRNAADTSGARRGPPQNRVRLEGNAYLRRNFPRLDYIKTARIIREWRRPG
jgi:peptidyl-prolyl cis-trans isomerase A (cyclophilin A)